MKALLVIDMQKGLFEQRLKVYREQELLDNVNRLIRKASAAGASVYVVQHCGNDILKRNTEGWRVRSSLKLPKGRVQILKRHGSCFEGTGLEEQLARRGEKTLVVCGLVTHGCVKDSCLDGLKRGFRITLVADGHSSCSKDAAALIEKWNKKIVSAGARLQNAGQVRFN